MEFSASNTRQPHQQSSSAASAANQPTIQSFKVATQHGDMLIIRQGVTRHHHHHHHHSHNSQHPQHSQLSQHSQHKTEHNQPNQQGHNQKSPAKPSQGNPAAIQNQRHQQQPDNASRPIMMTFHDLGLNSELQFAKFCQCDQMKLMLQTFTLFHVNFVGQEFASLNLVNWSKQQQTQQQARDDHGSSGSLAGDHDAGWPDNTLPDRFKYPSVDQLVECIIDVCAQLRIRSFIGLAVGAGAYIVCSLALVRPDLVDGLFLINPVMTRCSITEWLYFKISALSGHHNEKLHHQQSQSRIQTQQTGDTPAHEHGPAGGEKPVSSAGQQRRVQASHNSRGGGGANAFMKLLSNPHFHLAHHFSKQSSSSPHTPTQRAQQHSPASSPTGSQLSVATAPGATPTKSSSPLAVDQEATGSWSSQRHQEQSVQQLRNVAASSAGATNSSRLRWQILSRNFRNQVQQHRESQAAEQSFAVSGHTSNATSDPSATPDDSTTDLSSLGVPEGGLDAGCPESSGSASHAQVVSNEKAPMEYLMYHHFGPGTFQRAGRRPSDATENWSNPDSENEAPSGGGARNRHGSTGSDARSHKGSPVALGHLNLAAKAGAATTVRTGSESDQSFGEITANPDSAADELEVAKLRGKKATHRGDSSRSARATSAGRHQQHRQRSKRIASVNLNVDLLSSFSNDRQKLSYVQSIYRSYFEQMNPHNLWLFAQSFVKRKTLKLRKHCGAAAHAAAAAAALGSSVSLIKLHDSHPAEGDQHSGVAANHSDSTQVLAPDSQANPQRQQHHQQHHHGNQHHEVAGTKVKKTFACQTLIMCSNIQIHSDRAFKMMSMLNPLQASCIRSDHLLVLEERPDKVCQALRLFLQGIGYSMSTYERRLKLSSMQAGAGSNESRGSLSS